jgi:heat shock protein HtpX
MLYQEIASNKRRTVLLISVFILFITGLFYVFSMAFRGGIFLLPIGILIAIAMSWGSYYYSDRLVLAISKARPVEHGEFPYLDNTIEGLSIAAGIPKPKAYVIEDPSPNAFATGRDPQHAVIAVTTGLLDKMDRQELEGVIAHEMSHIGNYDIRLMAIVTTLVGMVVLVSDILLRSVLWGGIGGSDDEGGGEGRIIFIVLGLILAILAPIFATIIQLAISRRREFLADASGAMITRYPQGLASALRKLSADQNKLRVANKATAHLYIVNPLRDVKGFTARLFDTHPPIEERIKRLEEM